MLPVMEVRRRATQATADRFRDQPFAWGKNDCVRMVAFHLRKLGYRPKLAKAGSYSSALGAKRALARSGFKTIAEALDALGLERIAPAMALLGDIVQMPGDSGFDALGISLGGRSLLGYHEDLPGAGSLKIIEAVAVWRVMPR